MNYKFQLLNKVALTMEYFNKLLPNYPKNEFVLKQNIEKTYYTMMENLFSYNINIVERIKQKYLKDFLVNISMIDFYAQLSFKKKVISKRQFVVLGNRFNEIKKMTYSLIKKDDEKETD
ncbi:MAG: four helix bundle protein [Bacilli bacterium]|nr:four helix bundle protein [Bacilli bacterium]